MESALDDIIQVPFAWHELRKLPLHCIVVKARNIPSLLKYFSIVLRTKFFTANISRYAEGRDCQKPNVLRQNHLVKDDLKLHIPFRILQHNSAEKKKSQATGDDGN